MNKQRIYTLDAIKLIASIFIIFHHYQYIRGISFSNGINFYGGKIYVGYLVELFFMISGFVCEIKFEQNSKTTLKTFIGKRAVRIYPMAVMSICFYAFAVYSYRAIVGSWYNGEVIGIWKLLSSMLLVSQGGCIKLDGASVNNPTWYLCVLMLCYSFYGAVIRYSQRKKINPVYFYILMLFLGVGIIDYKINLPFANMESARGYISFFAGTLLYQINKKIFLQNRRKYSLFICMILSLLLGCVFSGSLLIDNQRYILIFIVYPLIIMCGVNCNILNKYFSNRYAIMMGSLSYELYLWHIPIMLVLKMICDIGGVMVNYSMVTMMIFTLGMVLLSIPLWRIEMRFDKRLKQLWISKSR